MTTENLMKLVADAGASATAFIKTEDIVLLAEARAICEKNGCGKYGVCYTCPPFVGEPDTLERKLRSYPGGILYQSVGALEDSFDFDGMTAAAKRHMDLSREIERRIRELRAKDPDTTGRTHLHLSKGGCDLCETCGAVDGTPCRFPDLALPSVESYGMDVYRTSKAAGLKYNNGPNTVTYFGLILFE